MIVQQKKIRNKKSLGLLMALLTPFLFAPIANAQISARHGDGGVIIGYDTGTCNSARHGALRYSSSTDLHEYCNGTAWQTLLGANSAGVTPAPTASDGYFVLTKDTWSGNLGGIAGANAKCLTDLTTYDWKGKSDATARSLLNGTKVKAFLCDSTACNNANASTKYYFAVSNETAKGGGSLTTDASAFGPNDSNNWAGMNYFGGAVLYWTGRQGGATAWNNTFGYAAWQICNVWTSGAAGSNFAFSGVANATDSMRHVYYDQACNEAKHLICFVHP